MSDAGHIAVENAVEANLISLEEVRMWSLEALKEYCRKRNYKVSGTRAELCSRVYVLYNNQTPEEPGAKELEASRQSDYRQIYLTGSKTTDPLMLTKWIGEKEGIKRWPPVSFVEVVKFVNKSGHSLASETLTSYKTGKAFGYFYSDWLGEVFYHPIHKTQQHCYLKAKCTPSNRLNDDPHSTWIKADKSSGEILSAYCSCVAGLSQTCNHVAALLFKIESAFRLDMSNPACTSTACAWKAPSSKKPIYMQLSDMHFTKPSHRRGKSRKSPIATTTKTVHMRENLVEEEDGEHYRKFVDGLRTELPTAVVFLPGSLKSQPTPADVVCRDDQPLEYADVLAVAEQCHSVKELLENISVTSDQIIEIESATRDQSENPLWLKSRQGRITASVFYKVHTKVETLKKKPATDCTQLVDSLINPSSLSHIPHIATGAQSESKAIAMFIKELSNMGHQNVSVKPCGLYILESQPYLGASPDGLVVCGCCEEAKLLEVKCPSRGIDKLPYLDDNKLLKEKSLYYGQVQGQLAITGLTHCYFYVFTEGSTCCDMVTKNQKFCKALFHNLELFYKQYMGPAVLKKAHNVKRQRLAL